MNYSDTLDMILKSELTTLIEMVRKKELAFKHSEIEKYNEMYNEIKHNK